MEHTAWTNLPYSVLKQLQVGAVFDFAWDHLLSLYPSGFSSVDVMSGSEDNITYRLSTQMSLHLHLKLQGCKRLQYIFSCPAQSIDVTAVIAQTQVR